MRRVRGLTIPEVLVAAFLLGLLMQLVISTLTVLERSKVTLLNRTEPRQQLRSFVNALTNDLRAAAYVFPPGSYDIMGTMVTTPGPGVAGDGIIFAVPENSTSPVTFTVCCAFTRPRAKPDSGNPNAYEAVYYYVTGVDPPGSDLPSEIDPNTLAGGSLKVFDAYIDGPEGFVTNLTGTGFGVTFEIDFRRALENVAAEGQRLSSTIVLRNGL